MKKRDPLFILVTYAVLSGCNPSEADPGLLGQWQMTSEIGADLSLTISLDFQGSATGGAFTTSINGGPGMGVLEGCIVQGSGTGTWTWLSAGRASTTVGDWIQAVTDCANPAFNMTRPMAGSTQVLAYRIEGDRLITYDPSSPDGGTSDAGGAGSTQEIIFTRVQASR